MERLLKKLAQKDQSAAEEIRTLTPFRALPPQSSASTSFATAAEGCKYRNFQDFHHFLSKDQRPPPFNKR